MAQPQVWLLTGSQHLYGNETLAQVEAHSRQVAGELGEQVNLPAAVLFKQVLTTPEEITAACKQANFADDCIGVIVWMHTFSPAKMWINGLKILHKPLLHLHTQFNRDLPWHTIDMDFMNLNQSAHGDREAAHLFTRMCVARKTVVGHFKSKEVKEEVETWIRAALGWSDWQGARFVRFGDNMRQVAVTEGDKVEAEIRLGFSVNTYGVGDLVSYIEQTTEQQVNSICDEYAELYEVQKNLRKGGNDHQSLRAAAKIEAGLKSFLEQGNYKGFTTTFEDLHGLDQLPGIAVQRLMAEGYGFAAEGDWKTAALVRLMKIMATGLSGGNSFMEDYTYHLEPGNEMVLGAHMLEICPSIGNGKPSCEIHPLSIGNKPAPVRLVFNGSAGAAINASIVQLREGFRMIVNNVEGIEVPHSMPKLPVARVVWKPKPDLHHAAKLWLEAGGAHHTCYSQNLTSQHLMDVCAIAGIEHTQIG